MQTKIKFCIFILQNLWNLGSLCQILLFQAQKATKSGIMDCWGSEKSSLRNSWKVPRNKRKLINEFESQKTFQVRVQLYKVRWFKCFTYVSVYISLLYLHYCAFTIAVDRCFAFTPATLCRQISEVSTIHTSIWFTSSTVRPICFTKSYINARLCTCAKCIHSSRYSFRINSHVLHLRLILRSFRPFHAEEYSCSRRWLPVA